jgi:hypothetical protein
MAETAHYTETYKSLITLSVGGFKFCALANGGAAVALLAYLGNVAGKGAATPDMRIPMAWFLAGLALCGLAMFLAYFTQLLLFRETRDAPLLGAAARERHRWPHTSSMIAFALSLTAFCVGSWTAVTRFT